MPHGKECLHRCDSFSFECPTLLQPIQTSTNPKTIHWIIIQLDRYRLVLMALEPVRHRWLLCRRHHPLKLPSSDIEFIPLNHYHKLSPVTYILCRLWQLLVWHGNYCVWYFPCAGSCTWTVYIDTKRVVHIGNETIILQLLLVWCARNRRKAIIATTLCLQLSGACVH